MVEVDGIARPCLPDGDIGSHRVPLGPAPHPGHAGPGRFPDEGWMARLWKRSSSRKGGSGVPVETILDALANALVSAYKRSGLPPKRLGAIDPDSGDSGSTPRISTKTERHPGVGRHPRGLRPDHRADCKAGDRPGLLQGGAGRYSTSTRAGRRLGRPDRPTGRPPVHHPRSGRCRGAHAGVGADPIREAGAGQLGQGSDTRGAT